MPEPVWQRIRIWTETIRGEQPGPLFTCIRSGDDVTVQRLTPQSVYHIPGQRQVKRGIGKRAPHDLRRTFASMMLDNEEGLTTVR